MIDNAFTVKVDIVVTDEMVKHATGLTILQVRMLSFIFENRYGVDPASLTLEAIQAIVTGKDGK